MPKKKYQNPKGGLNAAGRAFFKRTEGSNLKRPLKKGTSPSPLLYTLSRVDLEYLLAPDMLLYLPAAIILYSFVYLFCPSWP